MKFIRNQDDKHFKETLFGMKYKVIVSIDGVTKEYVIPEKVISDINVDDESITIYTKNNEDEDDEIILGVFPTHYTTIINIKYEQL